MATKEVSVIVRAQDAVTGPLREMKSGFESFASVVKGIGAAFVTGAVGNFFKGAVEDGVKAQTSMTDFDVALRGVGLTYKGVAPEAEKYLSNLQRTTKFTDEDGRDALTNMVTITGDYQKSLGLMSLAVEVATFRHISLADASTVVAKASNGVVKGLGDLGVTAKDGATAILQMRDAMGPFAEREGATFGGQLTIINNLWSEFKEKIGLAIIGSSQLSGELTGISKALVDAAKYVEANSDAIGKFVGFLAAAAEGVAKVGKFVVEHTPNLYTGAKAFGVLGDKTKDMAADTEAANQTVTAATAQMAGAFGTHQQQMTGMLAAEGGKRLVKTKEQIAAEDAAQKKAESERIAAAKKHAADLLKLQEEAQKAARELLSAHDSTRQEIVAAAEKAMVGMTSDQQTQAKAALKEHLDNLLLKWADFGSKLDTEYTQIGDSYKQYGEITTGVTEDFDAVLAKHGKHLDDDAVKTELDRIAHEAWKQTIVDTAGATADGAQKFLDMAEAAGVATPEVEALFNGISGISNAIASIAEGDILGGITSGLSVIGGIAKLFTGESESARRVRLALEKNRAALEESSRTIGDLIQIQTPGAKLAGAEKVLTEFLKNPTALMLGSSHNETELNKKLLAAGLSPADLQSIAKDLGIEISPNGKMSRSGLQQLLTMLGTIEPTQFRQDFQGQREQLRTETSLFNLTPAQQAAKLAALAGGPLGSGALGTALGGIDFGTAAGRGQGLAAIQSLFTALPGMKASDLGGLSGKELLDVLTELKDLLESAGIEATPTGPGLTSLPPPIAASVADVVGTILPGVDTIGPSVGGFADLLDVQVNARDLLRSIDTTLSGRVGGAAASIDASIQNLELVLNFGLDQAGNSQGIADAVTGGLKQLQADQVMAIEQALAKNYLNARLALGDATRS